MLQARHQGVVAVAFLLSMLAAAPALGVSVQYGSGGDPYAFMPWHEDLANRGVHRSVGMVNVNGSFNGSGTLIGRRWVLTAAHVVDTAASLSFTLNGKTVQSDRWFTPRGWNNNLSAGNDIALVRLAKPLRTGEVVRLYQGNARNKKVTSAGFGSYGNGLTGETFIYDNVRRALRNITDVTDYHADSRQLIYDFDSAPSSPNFRLSLADLDKLNGDGSINWDADMYPLTLEGGLTHGDSGGGLFVGSRLAGVHSYAVGGFDEGDVVRVGIHGGLSGSTAVNPYRRWIKTVKRRSFRGLDVSHMTRQGLPGDPIFDLVPTQAFSSQYLDPVTVATLKDMYGIDVVVSTARGYTVIPEPVSASILGLGSLMLLRRRRQAS